MAISTSCLNCRAESIRTLPKTQDLAWLVSVMATVLFCTTFCSVVCLLDLGPPQFSEARGPLQALRKKDRSKELLRDSVAPRAPSPSFEGLLYPEPPT